MSDIVNSAESDSREVLQATSVKMQAYAISNATVIEKAVHFIDRHMGLTNQNNKGAIDNDATETYQRC